MELNVLKTISITNPPPPQLITDVFLLAVQCRGPIRIQKRSNLSAGDCRGLATAEISVALDEWQQ